jgi:hypothetical protein
VPPLLSSRFPPKETIFKYLTKIHLLNQGSGTKLAAYGVSLITRRYDEKEV